MRRNSLDMVSTPSVRSSTTLQGERFASAIFGRNNSPWVIFFLPSLVYSVAVILWNGTYSLDLLKALCVSDLMTTAKLHIIGI